MFSAKETPLKWYHWEVFDWTTQSVAWIVWRRGQTNGIWEWNVGGSKYASTKKRGKQKHPEKTLYECNFFFTTNRTWTGLT